MQLEFTITNFKTGIKLNRMEGVNLCTNLGYWVKYVMERGESNNREKKGPIYLSI